MTAMTIGKFKTPATKATTATKKSRYAGISAAAPRPPFPCEGTYILECTSCEEGNNPKTGRDSFKLGFRVTESEGENASKVDSDVNIIELISGTSMIPGLARVKAALIALMGYEDEAEYDAFDPDGLCIEAATGASNDYSKDGNPVIGRHVMCQVTRGNTRPDGVDYYRNYTWAPVPAE